MTELSFDQNTPMGEVVSAAVAKLGERQGQGELTFLLPVTGVRADGGEDTLLLRMSFSITTAEAEQALIDGLKALQAEQQIEDNAAPESNLHIVGNAPQHDSDCATHNRGVPELLGPCDCSLSHEVQVYPTSTPGEWDSSQVEPSTEGAADNGEAYTTH